jgi:hypothetical protein
MYRLIKHLGTWQEALTIDDTPIRKNLFHGLWAQDADVANAVRCPRRARHAALYRRAGELTIHVGSGLRHR